jgi:hypothetical protein
MMSRKATVTCRAAEELRRATSRVLKGAFRLPVHPGCEIPFAPESMVRELAWSRSHAHRKNETVSRKRSFDVSRRLLKWSAHKTFLERFRFHLAAAAQNAFDLSLFVLVLSGDVHEQSISRCGQSRRET